MSTYIILMNLTDQGMRNIKDAPERIKEAAKALQASGGKMLAFYPVMGPYDYVAITEGPGDEAALAQLLALGKEGNVRTLSMKAFSIDEFSEIVKKLP